MVFPTPDGLPTAVFGRCPVCEPREKMVVDFLQIHCWLSEQLFVTRLAHCTSTFKTVMATRDEGPVTGAAVNGLPSY